MALKPATAKIADFETTFDAVPTPSADGEIIWAEVRIGYTLSGLAPTVTIGSRLGRVRWQRRRSVMVKDSKPKAGFSFDFPVFDFTKLLQQYKIPGVDFAALLEREKRNIEALTKANRIAFEGWHALAQRQSEILQETMAQTFAAARQDGSAKKPADLARQGFEKALDNMRELAEIATKSQNEAFEVVRKRIGENVEEMRTSGKK
jgi:phasin family protein